MNAAKEEFGGVWRRGVREAACTCAMPYMAISWWSAWRSERLGRRPLAICEKKRNKRAKKRVRRVAGLNADAEKYAMCTCWRCAHRNGSHTTQIVVVEEKKKERKTKDDASELNRMLGCEHEAEHLQSRLDVGSSVAGINWIRCRCRCLHSRQ